MKYILFFGLFTGFLTYSAFSDLNTDTLVTDYELMNDLLVYDLSESTLGVLLKASSFSFTEDINSITGDIKSFRINYTHSGGNSLFEYYCHRHCSRETDTDRQGRTHTVCYSHCK